MAPQMQHLGGIDAVTGAGLWGGVFDERFPASNKTSARRLLTLFVTLFFTALAGCILLNFRLLAEMMGEEEIHEHLCPRNETTSNGTASVQPLAVTTFSNSSASMKGTRRSVTQQLRSYACIRQEAASMGIYTYVFAASCVPTSLAGLLIDNVIPRHAAGLGRLLEGVRFGLIFLQLYGIGVALMAAGQQIAFVASLSVSHMFPTSRSLVCGLLGAFASVSMFVPAAVRRIKSALGCSLRYFTLFYGVTVTLLATFVGVPVLPHLPTPTSRAVAAEDTGAPGSENVETLASADDSAADVCTNQQSRVLTLNLAIAGTTSFLQAADRIFLAHADLVQYFAPAAAVPCVLLGVVADRWGASVASLIMAVAGLFMTSLSFVPNTAGEFAILTGLMLYISGLTSQVYWMSYEMFPGETSATVAGAIIALGAAISLVANVLYDRVTLQMLSGNTQVVRLGLGSIQLLQLLLIFVAYQQI